jgi:hypothetical protein
MRQVHRLPLYNPVPPQRKIKWCPLCPLRRKPSCQLQWLHGIQGPTTEDLPTTLSKNLHSSPHLKQTLHTQSGVTYSQITKHNSSALPHIHNEPPINNSLPHHYPQQPCLQQSNNIHELKTMMKGLFDQLGSMLNLLATS